ncbi:hypothetical protein IFM89_015701 [Coptis chinensis]|uniref:DUF4216 domain-containing protein n=1 Tax=Coptis chinensis TaxID=261450 RepID=A0A835ICT0_9MAGN|nr:hypothetical protein IFM89_015701 [Coptis chinensis]
MSQIQNKFGKVSDTPEGRKKKRKRTKELENSAFSKDSIFFTIHYRIGRVIMNEDIESGHPMDKKGKQYVLPNIEYPQVSKWVLTHSLKNAEWEEKYQVYLQSHKSRGKNRWGSQAKELDYIRWLRLQLQNEKVSPFKRIVDGPSFTAVSYNRYTANGYVFYTPDSESTTTTKNSGVSMKAVTSFRASTKDRNLVDDEVTYYGVVKRILELDYVEFKQTVFYCDWVRIEDKTNGCTVDPDMNLVFVNLGRFMRNTSEVDEPFILASEAKQVFYCRDLSRDNWHVVLDAPKRLSQEIDAYKDSLVFEARTSANDSSSTTLFEDILEIAEDWI